MLSKYLLTYYLYNEGSWIENFELFFGNVDETVIKFAIHSIKWTKYVFIFNFHVVQFWENMVSYSLFYLSYLFHIGPILFRLFSTGPYVNLNYRCRYCIDDNSFCLGTRMRMNIIIKKLIRVSLRPFISIDTDISILLWY